MKVYVVTDPNFGDPEMVFRHKKDALEYIADNKHVELHVYKFNVRESIVTDTPVGGERIVTNPSSY